MAQQLLEKLKELIQPILTILGYELWGCTLHYAGTRTLLRVYIELKPDESGNRAAVSLGDCSKVSREIEAVLDVEDIIKSSYNLEVSSPGMDRQLFTIEQYQRFVGSLLAVRLLISEEGRRNYRGRLVGIDIVDVDTDGSAIKLQVDDNVVDDNVNNVLTIPLVHIDKANIIPEF